jgi:hypothetical protein
MGYDEALAARIRRHLEGAPRVREQKMFGGLAFLVGGHMAVAATSGGGMMLRVDPSQEQGLAPEHARPVEMRGREMRGWLEVDPEALVTDEALAGVVDRGLAFVRTLPPKP